MLDSREEKALRETKRMVGLTLPERSAKVSNAETFDLGLQARVGILRALTENKADRWTSCTKAHDVHTKFILSFEHSKQTGTDAVWGKMSNEHCFPTSGPS